MGVFGVINDRSKCNFEDLAASHAFIISFE